MKTKPALTLTCFCLLHSTFCLSAFAQGSAFTYQGQLSDGGTPASGIYDLRFTIYDSTNNPGVVIAGPLTNSAITVSSGLFAVTLDFGASAFTGANRWLEVGVLSNGMAAFTPLTPRQKITPAPYAITASNLTGTVAASQLSGSISSSNIGAGSITTTMLAAGAVGSNQLAAGAVNNSALADGAVTGPKIAAVSNWFALPKIPNPTPMGGDQFGWSGALLGTDLLVIGAPGNSNGVAYAGGAYLFNTNGTLLRTFTNPVPFASDQFGIAVAAFGNDHILIGKANGAACLFTTSGTLQATFTNPVPDVGNQFGSVLAGLGDKRVIVGAPADSTGAMYAGAAYLFRTNGTFLTAFTNPTPANADLFGAAIAVVGDDRVLIGAYSDNTGATDSGAAYLFNTNGTLMVTFTNPAPGATDLFGWSLAAVGSEHVLIGAYLDDAGGPDSGAAYLFRTNGTLVTTFTIPIAYSGFGRSLAVAGIDQDQVLIAAEAAGLYLFNTNGTLLARILNPTLNVDDLFGASVAALDNNRFFSTAPNAVVADEFQTGVAYVLSFETYTPGVIADGVNGASVITASLADGAVTPLKLDPSIGVWTRSGNDVFRQSGSVGIGTASPGFMLHVNGSAGKPGGGTWSSTSDARLKKNIQPLAGALDKLLALHGVSFEYIDPEKIHELSGERLGLVAQEVEKVFPDWVETGPDGYKRVTVRGLEALVVESLRELQQQKDADIRGLNRKLDEQRHALRAEVQDKEKRIVELENRLKWLERQFLQDPHN